MLVFLTAILLFAQSASGGNTAAPLRTLTFDKLSRQAESARDANRMDEAIALYKRAVRLRPAWDEGWWNLGSITYDQDKYADCGPAFQRLTVLKPELSPGWIMSGLCEYALHNYAAARKSLLRAERLKFDGPPELSRAGRLHLALLLTKTGAFEKSIVMLTELTRMDRKTPQISVAAGIAGLRKPWLPSEVPDADRDRVGKLGDAMATAMELDAKGAIAKFEALLQENGSDPDIHFRFGALLMQQEPERGMNELRKTLELEPTHIPALLGLTMICLKNGDSRSALVYAEKAVTAEPGDFATHVALGRSLLDADDAGRAATELSRAVRLNPDSVDAHYSLASAYSRMGRKEDAQHEQEEFKRLRRLVDAVHP
jgi:tetratricopeptide (TPR) repeat protein